MRSIRYFLLLASVVVTICHGVEPIEARCFWGGGKKSSIKVNTAYQVGGSSEGTYVTQRESNATAALQSFLGVPTEEKSLSGNAPKVALCFSGGGYRAMIAGLGFLIGLDEIGLLKAATYMAGISGGAWNLAHWLLRLKECNASLSLYRRIVQERISKSLLDFSSFNFLELLEHMKRVNNERGIFEPADLWGAIIAGRLWGDIKNPLTTTLSDIAPMFQSTECDIPFPIFSLVFSDVFPYEWLEITPFMTGSDFVGGYIPTRALDSRFEKGVCKEELSEQSIGWMMAQCGSAYNFSIGDAVLQLAKESNNEALVAQVNAMIDRYNLHERRLLQSPIHNFAYKVGTSPLAYRQQIEISDGGMAFNLPFPAVLKKGRDAKILLVCDCSSNVHEKGYPEVSRAIAYMKRKGIKFPALETARRISENVSIFHDENDPEMPIMIYFANPVHASTLSFVYAKNKFDEICDGMKNLVVSHEETIREAIGSVAVIDDTITQSGARNRVER